MNRHFVVEITYRVPVEEMGETVARHRLFLQEGYDRGMLLFSGPQSPKIGGIVLARAESLETLQDLFSRDPYQIEGKAEYRFIEFTPVRSQEFMKDWLS